MSRTSTSQNAFEALIHDINVKISIDCDLMSGHIHKQKKKEKEEEKEKHVTTLTTKQEDKMHRCTTKPSSSPILAAATQPNLS